MRRGDSPTFGVLLIAVVLVISAGASMFHTPESIAAVPIADVQRSVTLLQRFVESEMGTVVSQAVLCTTCTSGDLQGRIQELVHPFGLTNTNFYTLVHAGNVRVTTDGNMSVVQLTGLWVMAQSGETSVTRYFDAELTVDSTGTLVRKIYKEKGR